MEQLSEIALFQNRFKSYLSDIALQFYVYEIKNLLWILTLVMFTSSCEKSFYAFHCWSWLF